MKTLPLRVAVMDDSLYTLLGKAQLLMRDVRTTVIHRAQQPEELLKWVRSRKTQIRPPDAFVLDAEYRSSTVLQELVEELRTASPTSSIICLAQYDDDPELLRSVIRGGANGFLVKEEVGLGLATVVYRACTFGYFVTSPTIADLLLRTEHAYLWDEADRLPRWEMHPGLSERQEEVAWLVLVFGMTAPMAADEMHVKKDTVSKYLKEVYKKLKDGWLEEADLYEIPGWGEEEDEGEDGGLRANEEAYHLLTQFHGPLR